MEPENKYNLNKLKKKFSLWYHNPNDEGWGLKIIQNSLM